MLVFKIFLLLYELVFFFNNINFNFLLIMFVKLLLFVLLLLRLFQINLKVIKIKNRF